MNEEMKRPEDTKFTTACRSILNCLDHFDDEVFGEEEEAKQNLRRFILDLADKYRQ